MKNVAILSLCLLAFLSGRAQTYVVGSTTVSVIHAASHDSTHCGSTYTPIYNVVTDATFVGDTIFVIDTSTGTLVTYAVNTTGVSPWSTSISLPTSYFDDYFTVSGAPGTAVLSDYQCLIGKIRHNVDTIFVTNTTPLYVANPCGYNPVSGRVYIDNNVNCIFDSGDVGVAAWTSYNENFSGGGPFYRSTSGSSITFSGSFFYEMQQSWMSNYTISLPADYAFIFPTSPCYTGGYIQTFTTLPMSNVDFPLECTSLVDVQCNALAPFNIRFGRGFYFSPYVTNTGCDTTSGIMTVILDHRLIYNAALSTLPADTVRGDTLIWNYNNLNNLTSGAYWNSFLSTLFLSLDSTVVVGDTICFSGYANIPAADINPANNSFAFCLPVVYSYDPNVKTVSPAGFGPEGLIPAGTDTLTYTLHFQNTGSATAINVTIIDTIDSHIDLNTFRILGTSAAMTPSWLAPGVVEFSFVNINLPDSGSNWAASQGEVSFKAALNSGLPSGTQIKNTGYIYFDSNPPVATNTTLNTIDTILSVSAVSNKKNTPVFPNPATEFVTIYVTGDATIAVMDLNGKILIQRITNGSATIDVSKLPSGVYLIRAISSKETRTTAFTKY